MSLAAFVDYYRCPEQYAAFFSPPLKPCGEAGFFRFGGSICYGQCAAPTETVLDGRTLSDVYAEVSLDNGRLQLPFDLTEIVDNLRLERYLPARKIFPHPLAQRTYYALRGLIPNELRWKLQRFAYSGWEDLPFPRWPLDTTVETIQETVLTFILKVTGGDRLPFIWFWPDGYSGAAIMTHDVDTKAGLDFCAALMDVDDRYGIKSSFQLIPEGRYILSEKVRQEMQSRGFEVNVHDLNHDGSLVANRKTFLKRAKRINQYAASFGALGFRSGMMYRNQGWYDALEFSYDMSVPNTAHLEPQQGGCCTVMPYFVGKVLVLPLTTTQDFGLFHMLNKYTDDLWKAQVALILQRHGLASFLVHPDYIRSERAQGAYTTLLAYLSGLHSEKSVWLALPREIDRWWRQRHRMQMVEAEDGWIVQGPGCERACIAYASLNGDKLVYQLEQTGRRASSSTSGTS